MERHACPGSRTIDLRGKKNQPEQAVGKVQSELRQWPVQMHLISPTAPYFRGADVLLTADCVAYALGGYHPEFLKGKSLAIACPKLDQEQKVYVEKIKSWFDDAEINTLTVMIMQVPCCTGLVQLAAQALQQAKRKVPIRYQVVSVEGEIIEEEWVDS